ncbi:MAG: helix-turn-helix domain-containing protein [Sphingobacteriales bacterium]|nr:MAG: helix-turn-helix domain-containing protein [Sphingobacteriales bacterium]
MKKRSHAGMAFLRVQLGITQQQLADEVGMSRSTISMGELGIRPMPARVTNYLLGVQELAQQNALPERASAPQRHSVATKRAPYNRIRFSNRGASGAKRQISTLNRYKSILNDVEIRMVGEQLKQRWINGGNSIGSAAAREELMIALQHKQTLLQGQLNMAEQDKATAPEQARQIRANISLLKAQLKVSRQLYKQQPAMRKKFRKRIASLYLKKLKAQEQLEKYNKSATKKIKQRIEELTAQLDAVGKLREQIEGKQEIKVDD